MTKNRENALSGRNGFEQFLLGEYGQCFSHMRHYDNIKVSVAKFAFSFYSAVATIAFAIERFFFFEREMHLTELFLGGFLVFTYVMGSVIIVLLARNRRYFVLVTKQVNSIRREFLAELSGTETRFENFLPIETDAPAAFNVASTHLMLIFFFAVLNSVALCFAAFFTMRYFNCSNLLFYIAIPILFVLSSFGEYFYTKAILQ